jgi:hydrogenase maturation protein HypF
LEVLAERGLREAGAGYVVEIDAGSPQVIGWGALWRALLADVAAAIPSEVIAARFHIGLAAGIARLAIDLAHHRGIERVVVSGGVMQNRLLLTEVARRLREYGLDVLMPRRVPANDGGIALGQAVIAAARHAISGFVGPSYP